jgi:hypothetical protein
MEDKAQVRFILLGSLFLFLVLIVGLILMLYVSPTYQNDSYMKAKETQKAKNFRSYEIYLENGKTIIVHNMLWCKGYNIKESSLIGGESKIIHMVECVNDSQNMYHPVFDAAASGFREIR